MGLTFDDDLFANPVLSLVPSDVTCQDAVVFPYIVGNATLLSHALTTKGTSS